MILLIDDDPSFAGDLASLLQPRDTLVWVNGSETGLKLIEECRPARILLDLNMPHHLALLDENEGLEVLRRLSADERGRVLIVTGSLTNEMRQQLDVLGVGGIYVKSGSVTRLGEMLG